MMENNYVNLQKSLKNTIRNAKPKLWSAAASFDENDRIHIGKLFTAG